MKHVIIGSGVVGVATGTWLEANKFDVTYYDIDNEVLRKLRKSGKKTANILPKLTRQDIFWICTHEKYVKAIIANHLSVLSKSIIVIRSTCPPGTLEHLQNSFGLAFLAHNPKFLREKTALDDEFNKDRIIIGTNNNYVKEVMQTIYKSSNAPIIFTDPTTSELIKYAANCWLSTQISYWSSIKQLCDKLNVNPQLVSNAVTLDKRISKYGSAMLGFPYSGKCFPKDMKSLIKTFKDKKINPTLLEAVEKVNEELK